MCSLTTKIKIRLSFVSIFLISISQQSFAIVDCQVPKVFRHYDEVTCLGNNGLAVVKLKNKFGLINQEGQIIAPIEYDSILPSSNGLSSVQKNGGLLINKIIW